MAAGIDLETLQASTPRVVDESRSVDPGRMAGSWQVNILKSHRHELKIDMLGVPLGAGSVAPDALFNQGPSGLGFTEVAGCIETRPQNVAYPGRIKLI